jgi:hypothetical protein
VQPLLEISASDGEPRLNLPWRALVDIGALLALAAICRQKI